MSEIRIKIGHTYQPRDPKAKPVTITGTCPSGIYKYVGHWDEGEHYQDSYSENGMVIHIETEFDLVKEVLS